MLRLRLIERSAAAAIVAGGCPPGLDCTPDYPAEADQIAARLFLERCAAGVDPRPYGAYLVCLAASPPEADLVIGGIGFNGGADAGGRVEIGYGIVPSRQGHGYATQALRLLIERARKLGATTLTAAADAGNAASQAVLRSHGFARREAGDRTVYFELPLSQPRY